MRELLKLRIIETCVIVVISSVIISFLVNRGIVPLVTRDSYLFAFALETLLFLIPSSWIMIHHYRLRLVKGKEHLTVNLLIFAALLILNVLGFIFLPGMIYTMFFGYTKLLQYFGVSKLLSMLIFYTVYLIDIVLIYLLRHKF